MFQCARYVGSQGKRDVIVKKRRQDFKAHGFAFVLCPPSISYCVLCLMMVVRLRQSISKLEKMISSIKFA